MPKLNTRRFKLSGITCREFNTSRFKPGSAGAAVIDRTQATEVFAKSYGDCKDKANLMRAMLKIVGITAFPVSIYSGDPTM